MSSRNRSAASCAAPAAAPSLRTPRRLRRRPVKAAAPGPAGGGRRSGPATPLLKWDVGGGGGRGEGRKAGADEAGDAARARETKAKATEVSVRRLAAGVWRLRPPEAVAGGGSGVRVGVEVRCAASPPACPPACLFRFRLGVDKERRLWLRSVSQIMNVDLSYNAISIARLTNHSIVLVFNENKNVRSKRPLQLWCSRSLALFGLLI